MKYLLFVFFSLVTFFSWTQNEKGCTIWDYFYFKYDDYSLGQSFSYTSPPFEFSSLDTFQVAVNQNKDILIGWNYKNEYYDMFYPAYDTMQWYYNDTLLEVDSYSFSSGESGGGCGGTYLANSTIKEVKLGYYQLRYIGADTSMDKTNYPVVHVYELEEANLTEEETPNETKLYPNPAKNVVNLELSKPIANGVMHVHNLQGQLVVSYPLNNLESTTHYDISQLNEGLYLFSVIDNEKGEEILRKKMIVQ